MYVPNKTKVVLHSQEFDNIVTLFNIDNIVTLFNTYTAFNRAIHVLR